MSMLTHGFEWSFNWAERSARISSERKAQLERAAMRALTVLTMGSVLTALIALKTAIYVWHLHA
ncbi:hypothetical protein [Bradyrhizobium ganzhouense]|uniref:hypothetical protein n=1 Tax=Bradyrhizobium ganzhouense TaxID=1179767 RepID=UPI003CF4A44F